jgi:hypothetical protein
MRVRPPASDGLDLRDGRRGSVMKVYTHGLKLTAVDIAEIAGAGPGDIQQAEVPELELRQEPLPKACDPFEWTGWPLFEAYGLTGDGAVMDGPNGGLSATSHNP